jgi:hypothetical protein
LALATFQLGDVDGGLLEHGRKHWSLTSASGGSDAFRPEKSDGEWICNSAPNFGRDSTMLNAAAEALGLNSQHGDALFVTARGINSRAFARSSSHQRLHRKLEGAEAGIGEEKRDRDEANRRRENGSSEQAADLVPHE